ncbi:NAD(P)H oxidoreductase [Alkalibacterium sp. AK22]|uniref:NAD(P)H-dependent oxidoreductase n=1 Tax=Alkalibacterium sp. AK22 TaxID=1229520 RepID=UPI00045119FF|nr:NAD(P)H-dependent oxidoreductase [Alkalibacterium sp. AK22]EXJ23476.1 NAD(P)H oxidoreductase [Alkalibacterium sp. AK22]
MKTLIIISHPEVDQSSSQQFLIQSISDTMRTNVTVHILEKTYPDGKIDSAYEQALLKKHDRILFQFPFYWYSSPPLLKKWQDEVLTEHFAFGYRGDKLAGKELGLVLSIGIAEKEYQTGGQEGYSISELTKPYQALARKTKMSFIRPLSIFQFAYQSEQEKRRLLVRYQQYVTLKRPDSLKTREKWMIEELKTTAIDTLKMDNAEFIINQTIDQIEDNRMELDELRMHIDNFHD